MAKKRKVQKTIQFFQPYQASADGPPVTSQGLISAIQTLHSTNDFVESALGDVRVRDKTPQGSTNAHFVLWLSQHEILTLERDGEELIPQNLEVQCQKYFGLEE